MPAITESSHLENALLFRKLMATYAQSEDLIRIGAYKPGSDAELDRALRVRQAMKDFMMQSSAERTSYADAVLALAALAQEF